MISLKKFPKFPATSWEYHNWKVEHVTQLELDVLIAKNNPHHYNGELIEKLEELLETFK